MFLLRALSGAIALFLLQSAWFVVAQMPGEPGFKFAGNYLDFWRDLDIETTPLMTRPTLFDVLIDNDPYMNQLKWKYNETCFPLHPLKHDCKMYQRSHIRDYWDFLNTSHWQ